LNKKTLNNTSKGKQVNISRISLFILLRPSKSILAKSKFLKNLMIDLVNKSNNRSYTQALKSNIKEIIKIKDAFPKLFPVVVTTSLRTTNSVMILILRVGYKNNFCIRETQENSIEIPLQTSLSFILLPMVCAHYCAPYSKWLCIEHEVNMWYPCCMTSFVLEPSTLFSQVSWPMLWPYHQIVTDVTVWLITSDPNPNCSKNRKMKSKSKEK